VRGWPLHALGDQLLERQSAADAHGDVVRLVVLARAVYCKMIQNLCWAFGYNIVAIPAAAGIFAAWGFILRPEIGALLMAGSTAVVVGERATAHARNMVEQMRRGDGDGADTWLRIIIAIGELGTPPSDARRELRRGSLLPESFLPFPQGHRSATDGLARAFLQTVLLARFRPGL
jgi:hypothetical protein